MEREDAVLNLFGHAHVTKLKTREQIHSKKAAASVLTCYMLYVRVCVESCK